MGAKQSSHNGRTNARNVANGGAVAAGLPESSRVVSLDPRIRTRSLNNVGHSLSIPGHSASFQESDLSSSPEDNSPSPRGLAMQGAHSLPSHLFATYTTFLNGKIKYIHDFLGLASSWEKTIIDQYAVRKAAICFAF